MMMVIATERGEIMAPFQTFGKLDDEGYPPFLSVSTDPLVSYYLSNSLHHHPSTPAFRRHLSSPYLTRLGYSGGQKAACRKPWQTK
jgi:hypothetical protein